MKWITFILIFSAPYVYGQVVQNFELTNAVDGNTISLKNFSSNPAVVIIISNINCPYTEHYVDRIKILANMYTSKVPVLMINSSTEENESLQEMTAFARQHNITFPYLADKEQKVHLILNPRKSPEAFLLQNTSEKFKVVYRGAIDDNPQSANDVKHAYLREAIDALLSSQKIEPVDVRPVGCSLKKD